MSAAVFSTHKFSHGPMGDILHRYHATAGVATACSCGGFSSEIKYGITHCWTMTNSGGRRLLLMAANGK
jgi:hypothetical protein